MLCPRCGARHGIRDVDGEPSCTICGWVDYSGPITDAACEGLTLFDHPSNPNHPSVFHVRNDGWMGASLTHDAPLTLERGESLRLRYGILVHEGVPERQVLDAVWQEFAKSTPPDLGPSK